jgi:hypothetical protein
VPHVRLSAFVRSVSAVACMVVVSACSAGSDSAPDDVAPSGAPKAHGGSGDDFCQRYSEAGGTLATPGAFQVGMPAQQTVGDLTQRVAVLEAATPPDEIATQWETLRGRYTEVIGLAEKVPNNGSLVDPRVFEIVNEIGAPSAEIRDYLDANC